MRKDGYALLMALSLAVMVSLGAETALAAALLAVRTAQEAEQSRLEGVALDGQINALLLRMTGEIRELLRESLQGADLLSDYSFGDGSPSGSTTAMAPLAQIMQSRVEAMVCADGQQRVYFSRRACGEDLPASIQLPAQPGIRGYPALPTPICALCAGPAGRSPTGALRQRSL